MSGKPERVGELE